MIGIVLVTHGRLAQEIIAAMEHMVGPQPQLRAVCIGPEDDVSGASGKSLLLRIRWIPAAELFL